MPVGFLTIFIFQSMVYEKTFKSMFFDTIFSDENKMLSVGTGLTYAAQKIGAHYQVGCIILTTFRIGVMRVFLSCFP